MGAAGGASRLIDVLIVSLGSTQGLRTADRELRDSLAKAGASVALTAALAPRQKRTLMLTDLAWARAARAAALSALAEQPSPPAAIVYSSTTAALLWPRPGAIRFDAAAAGKAFIEAQSELMRAVGKGVVHKNTGARKVSRLAARLKSLAPA